MGRLLISAGIVLVLVGLVINYVGRLPGDIRIEGRHGSFYFPVVTCILISVLLSLVSWLFRSR